jgi:hypothetical protein
MEQFLAILTKYAGIAKMGTLILAPVVLILVGFLILMEYKPEWAVPVVIKMARLFGKRLTPPPSYKQINKKR